MGIMPESASRTPPANFGTCDCAAFMPAARRRPGGRIANLLAFALQAESLAAEPGFLQRRDPRFKIGSMLLVIMAAAWAHQVFVVWCFVLLGAGCALVSKVPLQRMLVQAWLPVLAFTGVIALPALFLVPGPALARLPVTGWAITANGLHSALLLVGRAEAAAGIALLLVLTTPWPQVIRALGALGVPAVITAMLAMTQRYIFIFLQTAADMQEAHHSRMMAPVSRAGQRRLIASAAGVLFTRSLDMGQHVHEAMLARGYQGRSLSLATWRVTFADVSMIAVAAALLAAVVGLGL